MSHEKGFSPAQCSPVTRFHAAYAHRINTTDPTDSDALRALFTELLGHYGEGAEIRPPFRCDYGYQTSFGARSFANFGLVVLDVTQVTIGEDVQIGDNVWLGGGVIVCPGVTIGADTVVGAGSEVTRDLPAGVIAVGSPARVVREL